MELIRNKVLTVSVDSDLSFHHVTWSLGALCFHTIIEDTFECSFIACTIDLNDLENVDIPLFFGKEKGFIIQDFIYSSVKLKGVN